MLVYYHFILQKVFFGKSSNNVMITITILQEKEALKNKRSFLDKIAETRQMSVREAVKVLNFPPGDDVTVESVEERHATILKMNEECKRKSPYLCAKINNAKEALLYNIKGQHAIKIYHCN